MKEYLLGERRGMPKKVVCDAFQMNYKDSLLFDELSFYNHVDFTAEDFAGKSKFLKSSFSETMVEKSTIVSERPVVYHPALPFLYCQPEYVIRHFSGKIGLCLTIRSIFIHSPQEENEYRRFEYYARLAMFICSASFAVVSMYFVDHEGNVSKLYKSKTFESSPEEKIKVGDDLFEGYRKVLTLYFEHVYSIKLFDTE